MSATEQHAHVRPEPIDAPRPVRGRDFVTFRALSLGLSALHSRGVVVSFGDFEAAVELYLAYKADHDRRAKG